MSKFTSYKKTNAVTPKVLNGLIKFCGDVDLPDRVLGTFPQMTSVPHVSVSQHRVYTPEGLKLDTFYNYTFDKGRLKSLVSWSLKTYGEAKTIVLLENLKKTGFEYATKAGISLGIEDLKIPPKKAVLLYEAELISKEAIDQYTRSEITGVERFQRLIETWHRTSEDLKQEVIEHFEKTNVLNPVYMMAFSGARGNISQVRQLVGMRGLMSDPKGQLIDYPIRSNFREGLTITEYIISSYGARKGIVDTALRTANAGYLTRRLVDVAQHVVISSYDCGTHDGVFLTDIKEGNKTLFSLQTRLLGRVLARDLYKKVTNLDNEKLTSLAGPVNIDFETQSVMSSDKTRRLASRNQEVSASLAAEITKHYKKVFVRSALTCHGSQNLICQLCYGWSLAQGKLVSIGEAVGIVAAQSIGEPGTQLTMRTFHTGGAFAGEISDQIFAPFNGVIHYSNNIAGILCRNSEGKIAFLTKVDGVLFFTASDGSTQQPKQYKIPAYTLLYFKSGEVVIQKQVIAQISTIAQQVSMQEEASLIVKSQMQGEFMMEKLKVQTLLTGPKSNRADKKATDNSNYDLTLEGLTNLQGVQEMETQSTCEPSTSEAAIKDKILAAWNWGYAWILSCQRYKTPMFAYDHGLASRGTSLIPCSGDFVDNNSAMVAVEWFLPQHGGFYTSFATPTKSLTTNSERKRDLGTGFVSITQKANLNLLSQPRSLEYYPGHCQKNVRAAGPPRGPKNYAAQAWPEMQQLPGPGGVAIYKNTKPKRNNVFQNLKIQKNLLSLDIRNVIYKKIGYFVDTNKGLTLEGKTYSTVLFLPTNLKGLNTNNLATNSLAHFTMSRSGGSTNHLAKNYYRSAKVFGVQAFIFDFSDNSREVIRTRQMLSPAAHLTLGEKTAHPGSSTREKNTLQKNSFWFMQKTNLLAALPEAYRKTKLNFLLASHLLSAEPKHSRNTQKFLQLQRLVQKSIRLWDNGSHFHMGIPSQKMEIPSQPSTVFKSDNVCRQLVSLQEQKRLDLFKFFSSNKSVGMRKAHRGKVQSKKSQSLVQSEFGRPTYWLYFSNSPNSQGVKHTPNLVGSTRVVSIDSAKGTSKAKMLKNRLQSKSATLRKLSGTTTSFSQQRLGGLQTNLLNLPYGSRFSQVAWHLTALFKPLELKKQMLTSDIKMRRASQAATSSEGRFNATLTTMQSKNIFQFLKTFVNHSNDLTAERLNGKAKCAATLRKNILANMLWYWNAKQIVFVKSILVQEESNPLACSQIMSQVSQELLCNNVQNQANQNTTPRVGAVYKTFEFGAILKEQSTFVDFSKSGELKSIKPGGLERKKNVTTLKNPVEFELAEHITQNLSQGFNQTAQQLEKFLKNPEVIWFINKKPRFLPKEFIKVPIKKRIPNSNVSEKEFKNNPKIIKQAMVQSSSQEKLKMSSGGFNKEKAKFLNLILDWRGATTKNVLLTESSQTTIQTTSKTCYAVTPLLNKMFKGSSPICHASRMAPTRRRESLIQKDSLGAALKYQRTTVKRYSLATTVDTRTTYGDSMKYLGNLPIISKNVGSSSTTKVSKTFLANTRTLLLDSEQSLQSQTIFEKDVQKRHVSIFYKSVCKGSVLNGSTGPLFSAQRFCSEKKHDCVRVGLQRINKQKASFGFNPLAKKPNASLVLVQNTKQQKSSSVPKIFSTTQIPLSSYRFHLNQQNVTVSEQPELVTNYLLTYTMPSFSLRTQQFLFFDTKQKAKNTPWTGSKGKDTAIARNPVTTTKDMKKRRFSEKAAPFNESVENNQYATVFFNQVSTHSDFKEIFINICPPTYSVAALAKAAMTVSTRQVGLIGTALQRQRGFSAEKKTSFATIIETYLQKANYLTTKSYQTVQKTGMCFAHAQSFVNRKNSVIPSENSTKVELTNSSSLGSLMRGIFNQAGFEFNILFKYKNYHLGFGLSKTKYVTKSKNSSNKWPITGLASSESMVKTKYHITPISLLGGTERAANYFGNMNHALTALASTSFLSSQTGEVLYGLGYSGLTNRENLCGISVPKKFKQGYSTESLAVRINKGSTGTLFGRENPLSYLQKQKILTNENRCLVLTHKDLFGYKFVPEQISLAQKVKGENSHKIRAARKHNKSNQSTLQFASHSTPKMLLLWAQNTSKNTKKLQLVRPFLDNRAGVINKEQSNPGEVTDTRLPRCGQLIRKGQTINISNVEKYYSASGQIVGIHWSLKQPSQLTLSLRKGQPILISSRSTFHSFHGDFVHNNEPVVTLIYQKIKTGDIIQGIPKVEQFFEARTTKRGRLFKENLPNLLKGLFLKYYYRNLKSLSRVKQPRMYSKKASSKNTSSNLAIRNSSYNATYLAVEWAVNQSFYKIQQIAVDGVLRVYRSQGVSISDKHLEIIVKQMTTKVRIIDRGHSALFPGELVDYEFVKTLNSALRSNKKVLYEPIILGITKASLHVDSFLSAASFQQTARILRESALFKKRDFLKGVKENVMVGNLIPTGTGYILS